LHTIKMAIMYRFLLLAFSVYQVISETENIAINTERDFLATTDLEAGKRGPIHDTDIPLMFIRAAASKSKWGGGDYPLKKQKEILTAHNDFRRGVNPSSSDMNELVWSSKLAKQAQAWSDGCVYEHPDKTLHTDYEGIGQNLYIKYNDAGGNNPPSPASDPVTQWHCEVRDFRYGSNTCNEG
ncbi:CAP domain-containing protein, partial [Salmonella sp. s55004]|uniref:CAP domain-containing protein n=1 Tax=Salmonella sp. s55004 TaxID=3159675 RepID=UPI003980A0A6